MVLDIRRNMYKYNGVVGNQPRRYCFRNYQR